jgi:peptidoglycan/LPS O-acetylase OafA/YrhL
MKSPNRLWLLIYSFGFDLNYVIFMLIGVVFHQHYQKLISHPQLVFRSLFIYGVFALNWAIGPQKEQFPIITNFYFYALIIFSICYACREFFRPNKIVDFFADISFPIYITHNLLGYIALKFLMDEGLSFGPAICIVLTGIFILSCLLHFFVELPSNRLGKRWASRYAAKKLPVSTSEILAENH